MNHVLIGQLAGALAILQIIPYVRSILRGDTKPERMSYLIWFIVDVVILSSYFAVGARTTIWAVLVFTVSKLLILGLSIKRGMGGVSHFDIGCFLLALVGIIIWISTKNALIALYFSTFVMLLGYLPTFKKAYLLPKTENRLSWVLATMASVLNLFALTTLMPSISLLPIAGMVADVLVVYLLLFPVSHAKRAKKRHPRIHIVLTHPIFLR
ncbi:MAG TPA: hypothetical protein VIH90_05155 [Candidatus Saccharimonadales bacterium]